jgi:hypothetical protein
MITVLSAHVFIYHHKSCNKNGHMVWRTSKLLDGLSASPKVKIAKGGVEAHSLVHNILGVEGRVRALGWGLKKLINNSITHTDLHKPNNKLVNA